MCYGVSFVNIFEKIDCVITAPHCIDLVGSMGFGLPHWRTSTTSSISLSRNYRKSKYMFVFPKLRLNSLIKYATGRDHFEYAPHQQETTLLFQAGRIHKMIPDWWQLLEMLSADESFKIAWRDLMKSWFWGTWRLTCTDQLEFLHHGSDSLVWQ